MKLTKEQQIALNEFNETGYVLVDSYRRGGKTFLLKTIMSAFPIRDIGVFCPSYAFFKHMYPEMPGYSYLNFNNPIIIGDEYILSPHMDKKIACAITGLPKVNKWLLKNNYLIDKKQLIDIKKSLTKEAYSASFGNYKK